MEDIEKSWQKRLAEAQKEMQVIECFCYTLSIYGLPYLPHSVVHLINTSHTGRIYSKTSLTRTPKGQGNDFELSGISS